MEIQNVVRDKNVLAVLSTAVPEKLLLVFRTSCLFSVVD